MRVLYVLHGLRMGGLERIVVQLASLLPHPEFEQAVCCLDLRGELADELPAHVPVTVLGRGRHDLKAPLRLAGLLREYRPDLIHACNWNAWPDTVLAHRLAGRPGHLLWAFHGFAEGQWFPWRRRVLSRLLARLSDSLLTISHDTARRYSERVGVAEERFRVLYNGVDTERYRPADEAEKKRLRRELDLPVDAELVLTVASLVEVKNHAALLRAAARVVERRGERVRFLLLGEGPLRPRLEEQVADLGLRRQVMMPGNSSRVPDYLRCADLFVLPSRLEGMSCAIQEAMASGLPVVAHRVGGNPELVEDGVSGRLCALDDDAALADGIAGLLEDTPRRAAMGAAGRRRAVQRFSLEAMLEAYAELYHGLVEGKR
jgi:glycosyltransferase involved in cell wall biosynthesis